MKQGSTIPIYRSAEQERILAELFALADGPLSLSELAERTSTSLGGVHKEVERLQAAGLVKSTTVGRSRLVEADPASPLYRDIRSILLKTRGPEPLLREALQGVNGIDEAWIYGSWADPNARAPSDVDVFVIGSANVGVVYDAIAAVEEVIGRPVNVTIRLAEEWRAATGGFEESVRKNPRIALI